eukprot:TRINITY_DN7476_c0_g1_i6.p1 TRINITY_DN7476_c0_g1~~TRINITY_DN7476_c0_g1_i6.p1  ORF type:complete len:281 (-),score=52.99 TRINITY_DN7476_c0_g1_i6:191-1033(-)
MFPYSNVHYIRHHNIGDSAAAFKSDTEYKRQYLKYPSKEYHLQLEGTERLCREPEAFSPKRFPDTNNKMEYKSEERGVSLEQSQYKYEPEYSPPKQPLPEREMPANLPPRKLNYKYQQSPYCAEYRPKLPKERPSITPNETKEEKVSDEEEMAYQFPSNLPAKQDSIEEKERKTRAKKYKEYLDLQMQLNGEKQRYEQAIKRKSNEQFRNRSNRLYQVEQDIAKRTRQQQAQLADIYEKQIREKALRNVDSVLEGENSFSNTLDINRQRYYKVRSTNVIQ